ncbi:MAG: sugar phosphate isomerase/epimerase family protein [Gemmataceae bacterium]
MKTIKGPAIFLAQFAGDQPPYNSLPSMAEWAARLGYVGIQIPAWDRRLFDLNRAAASAEYCAEINALVGKHGLQISELATHLQGQLVAVHPAYDTAFDAFAPKELHGQPVEKQAWAVDQIKKAATASRRLGCSAMVTFSGGLAWPFVYPWPQRPAGLIDTAFRELARRWRPILDHCDSEGIDCCFEIHPGEDLHDGVTFERFLDAVGHHPRCRMLYDPSHLIMQGIDYLAYLDHYHEFIKMFHVKDAEFNPTGRSGFYGGFQSWLERPARTRSLGDGQIDFGGIFSKLAQYNYSGWAVLEWECVLKHPDDGAREGAEFIRKHIIRVTDKTFDDFAGGTADQKSLNQMLGLPE